MPLLDVDEPHARPPRLAPVRPGRAWSGPLDLDRGWAELDGVEVADDVVDLTDCDELSIGDSVLGRVVLSQPGGTRIEIRSSRLDGCDLSQADLAILQRSTLDGCKLTGTDLSGAAITDVRFVRCAFRYANLRMARLERVGFVECTIDEVDGFQLDATDVSFEGSSIVELNVDRIQATRVDLRGATELGLIGIGRLEGCLVSDHQLPALGPVLALAVGLDLER